MFKSLKLTLLFFTGLLPATTLRASKDGPPNVIIIYADDLGYGDLGCYGHPSIRTPHLDKMAAEGVRFTDFYSAAEVCTPSRAALLTGRYPVRSGMCHDQIRVLRAKSTGGLPAEEVTLAELLKAKGYATACIGKWHLGVWANNPAHHPQEHGFDHYYGLPHSNDMDGTPALPKGGAGRLDQDPKWWNAPLYKDSELAERPADQTTLTQRYTEAATDFIKQHRQQPFFLYMPHNFPHVPLFASEKFKGKSPRGLYGDVVEELDASVGAVLQALKDAEVDDRTLVVFSSDNGPWLIQNQAGGSAGLLREGKGSTWEGGMRVPCLARWPGKIPAGSVQREMASTMDLYPTCAALADAPLPEGRALDGKDIRPMLFGTGDLQRTSPFLYYRGTRVFAARLGPWKAHFITQPAYGPDQPLPHDPPELYHLAHDPSERFNLATQNPEVVKSITQAAKDLQASIQTAPTQLEGTISDPPK
jgi:arylsulfatase A